VRVNFWEVLHGNFSQGASPDETALSERSLCCPVRDQEIVSLSHLQNKDK